MKIKDPNNIPPHVLRLMPESERPKGALLPEERAEAAASAADAKLEKEIQNRIEGYLGTKGVPCCRPRMDKKSHIRKGWPDFTFSYRGRFIGAEVKTPENSLSDDQKEALKAIRAAPSSGLGVVVRSMEDVVELLRIIDDNPSVRLEELPGRFTEINQ